MAIGGSPKKRARPAKPAPEPPPAAAEPPRKKRRFRVTEAGVALIALLVSGTAFFINGMLFLRGSDVAVMQPDHFLLYRDVGPHGSDLYLAVPVAMINAASADYGDVVTRATAMTHTGKPSAGAFDYEAVVEPVVTPMVERGLETCPQGARCIPATGFYVIERPARLLDVPGGSSRSEYLSFLLTSENCSGASNYCRQFDGFDAAVRALRSQPDPRVRVHLRFHFDGDHEVQCRLPESKAERDAIFDYLTTKGWAMPACEIEHDGPRAAAPSGLKGSIQ